MEEPNLGAIIAELRSAIQQLEAGGDRDELVAELRNELDILLWGAAALVIEQEEDGKPATSPTRKGRKPKED